MRKIFWTFIFFCWINGVQAQDKFWIIFKDKPHFTSHHYVSPQTEVNRKLLNLPIHQLSDAPVFKGYIDSLTHIGVASDCASKWLNAVSAYLDKNQIERLEKLPFVEEIHPINQSITPTSKFTVGLDAEAYSAVMKQLNANAFAEAKLSGKNVLVGVIDVGFFGLTMTPSLQHLVQKQRIMKVKDYVNPAKTSFFTDLETESDYHGTVVVQMITGYDQDRKLQYGMATDAQFCLARTDHGIRETRSEEENWVSAMEFMDSLGVRLINTSLGYALGFTDPKENYKPAQMDGKTSIISKATHIASEEKGILLVVSAGNEGDDPNWRIVSTPADSKSVLSVGSTEARQRSKIGYSSIGPEFLPYLKPNVVCYSSTGTSFSAPVITGFAACLMEQDSTMTNKQITHIIEKSGHLYPYGNNFMGYGVPDASRALQLVMGSTLSLNKTTEKHQRGNSFYIEVGQSAGEKAVIFHKKKGYYVLKQEVVPLRKNRLEVKRLANVDRTTIDLGNEIVEVFWED